MARYGKNAQRKIKLVMREFKSGELKSGHSHQKVTNRKQALAIAISQARKENMKVPKVPKR